MNDTERYSSPMEETYRLLTTDEREYVYLRVWTGNVKRDLVREFAIPEAQAEEAAERLTVDGQYDPSISYWDNLRIVATECRRNIRNCREVS